MQTTQSAARSVSFRRLDARRSSQRWRCVGLDRVQGIQTKCASIRAKCDLVKRRCGHHAARAFRHARQIHGAIGLVLVTTGLLLRAVHFGHRHAGIRTGDGIGLQGCEREGKHQQSEHDAAQHCDVTQFSHNHLVASQGNNRQVTEL